MEEQEQVTKTVATASRLSAKKRFFLFAGISMVNLFGLAAASIAWFNVIAKETRIDAVSGDLNVDIKKVTAYKYAYPFYDKSTEFINYDGEGQVKTYVVQDSTIEGSFNDNPVSLAMTKSAGNCYREVGVNDTPGPTAIHYHHDHNFDSSKDTRYYLIGDEVFTGVTANPWSTKSALPFSSTLENSAVLENVIVSAGSTFILFDALGLNGTNCSYFSYSGSLEGASFISENNGTTIKCQKAGIYKFTFESETVGNQTSYTLTIEKNRDDDAAIGNGILDTTKISIDYYGMSQVEKTAAGYNSVIDYLPRAIYEQNTTVIFDVELAYKNANPITAGLKVVRNSTDSSTVSNFDNALQHLEGVVTTKNGNVVTIVRNPVHASDFYSFRAVFAKEENAYGAQWSIDSSVADIEAMEGQAEVEEGQITKVNENNRIYRYDGESWHDVTFINPIWFGLHRQYTGENELDRFPNDSELKTSITCSLRGKESDDSLVIPPSLNQQNEVKYHCYIAVDYDFLHMRFFMNENRLGKTYFLDRDFGFYFTGEQYIESSNNGGEHS